MNCRALTELIPLYAIGALEPDEEGQVREHLDRGCPRCQGALCEARAVAAQLPLGLEPVAPSANLRRRVLAAAARGGAASGGPARPQPEPEPQRAEGSRAAPRGRWLVPALAAGAAAVLLWLGVVVPLERKQETLRAELKAQRERIARLEQPPPPPVRVPMAGVTDTDAVATITFDRARSEWWLDAANLAPTGERGDYQLWFIDAAGRKRSAGVFDADARGHGALTGPLPADLEAITTVAVTDEPEGGSPQPTGAIQLAGQLPPAGGEGAPAG